MNEELVRVQIVFTGFVYDPDHSMPSRERVLKYRIQFSELKRRRIVVVPYTDRIMMVLDFSG